MPRLQKPARRLQRNVLLPIAPQRTLVSNARCDAYAVPAMCSAAVYILSSLNSNRALLIYLAPSPRLCASPSKSWCPPSPLPFPAVLNKHLELLRGSSRDAAQQLEADRKRYREHLSALRGQLAAFQAHLSATTAVA